jgi:oligopeptidase B
LRTLNTSKAPVLLRVNMEAGHGGRSGRFTRLEQVALEYAFILHVLGKTAGPAVPLRPS